MRRLRIHRRVLVPLIAVAAIVAMALWPDTVDVDVAVVSRGPLVVTVDEEGRTRVRDRFVVSAPVGGRVLRIELEPGDRVERGDIVARLDAGTVPPLLDARTRAEGQAALDVARAAADRARADADRADAVLAQARRELERAQRLTEAGAMPAQDLDMREADARIALEAAAAARSAVRAAAAEIARAEARLADPPPRPGRIVAVAAPAAGVVLRRLRESESVVPAGEPLVEIGDPTDLEVVADLLSSDAARIAVGARATVEQWGEGSGLTAVVRRIEPSGFTKISALGVEEQRVNVILDLDDAGEDAPRLGDAYRVDVRIVIWEAADVLTVPTSALFREGSQWAVYEMRDGRARRTLVEIGQQTGRDAEVLAGSSEGTRVIVHPGDAIHDGTRVRPSAAS